jgi:MFS family permease
MEITDVKGAEGHRQGARHSALVTLVLIPLVIAVIWLLENYLLAGNTRLFRQASPSGLVIYSVLAGILVGIVVPAVRIRAAFLSGAVNMFQIGFRSTRRTVAAVSLTTVGTYAGWVLLGLSGQVSLEHSPGAALFILLLPAAIAAVMICWVLVGTHVQAYVRSDGAMISVFAGVLLTALVFALSMAVLCGEADVQEAVAGFFAAGCVAALFFFAVRDVYATIIVVTTSLVVLENSHIDPAYLVPFSPVVALCGILTTGALVGVHWHFSRHYTTVVLPGK